MPRGAPLPYSAVAVNDAAVTPAVSTSLTALLVGDRFIPSSTFVAELDRRMFPTDDLTYDTVEWSGDKASQHAAQQVMELEGPNAVEAAGELFDAVSDVEVLCVHFAPVGAELIARAKRLRRVVVARAGLENVDLEAAAARGITVTPIQGRNAGAVAELQIGLMLAEARNISRADRSVKEGHWRKEFHGSPVEIGGSRVGMVGLGHVGRAFARRLLGFDAVLTAFDPYVNDEAFKAHGVIRSSDLETIFATSDFVVIQARLTDETRHMIGANLLNLLRPSAFFINVARSRIVDMDALYSVLSQGRLAGAGLDVFDDEPLRVGSVWRDLDNVTLTTHFGGDTQSTNRVSAGMVADALLDTVRAAATYRDPSLAKDDRQ